HVRWVPMRVKISSAAIFLLLALLIPVSAFAAAIKVFWVSDLDFGTAAPGDSARTVSPGTAESATNGSFRVTGNNNATYSIVLPTTVNMITGAGGANRTIVVNTFVSYPAAGANGLLDGTGVQFVYVGATRDALPVTQIAGTYAGNYTITVVY
ncbi:MAG: DUF4402 domain-containing protein, partial [Bdellovibrionota bacterium]